MPRTEVIKFPKKNVKLTLESVSTLISVVIFWFFNWVLTSATNSSPFLVPDDVIAYSTRHKSKFARYTLQNRGFKACI